MKLHGEYDYECIRNSLSSYHVQLAINLPWPALKNKQRMCFDLNILKSFWHHQPISVLFIFLSFFVVDNQYLQIIEIISHKASDQ